jgi:hypothetical protein
VVALGMTTLALAPVGFLSMFSVYRVHDDEGYFLVTLRDYIGGHADYSQIYGPFFWEVMGGAFRILGLGVTTDNGRLVTLAVWLVASIIGGITVLTLTRNLWLGAAGQFLTFHSLAALTNGPMHPQGLIALLLVCLAASASYRSRTPRTSAVLIGSVVAALALVKVNVGAFAALAVAFALASTLSDRWRRVAMAVTGLALVAGPIILMAGQFGLGWVRELALLISFSVAAVGIAGIAAEPPYMPRSYVVRLIAGGAAVTVICLGIAAVGGMRPHDLVDSLRLALSLPQLFIVPSMVNIPEVVWAALSLAAAGGILWRRFGERVSPALPAALRIAAGGYTLLSVLLLPRWFFPAALPLAWIAVVPPAGDRENPIDGWARLLLATLAVIETLLAYPVAGDQEYLAALMLVPVGAITFNDGIRQLRAWAATQPSPSFSTVASSLAPGALLLNVGVWPLFAYLAASAYVSGQPLGVPGTALMRVPPAQAANTQALVRSIDRDCTTVITMPRMPSLYLWAGRTGISQLNPGIWMFSLDASQQQSIVSQIQDQPGTCVVVSQLLVDFWAQGRPVPQRPLVNYINTAFEPEATFGVYELLVRKPQ